MFEEPMKDAWKRAEAAGPRLSRAAIEQLLRPGARRTGRALESVVLTHVIMLGISVVLAVVNLYGYRANAGMLTIVGALAVLAILSGSFGAWIIARLRRIEPADLPLIESVEHRLSLCGRAFELWLVAAAATPWFLSTLLNMLIDNESGKYRVNQPGGFIVMTAVMFGITYFALRVSLGPTVREMRAMLHDLRAEALDATPQMMLVHRQARRRIIICVVGLAAVVLGTVVLWLC